MASNGKAASTNKRILSKSESRNGKLDSPSPLAQPHKCPECKSQRIWKDGIRYTRHGEVQRYLCRSCGYRFSEPNVKVNIISKAGEVLDSVPKLTCKMVGSTGFSFKKSLDSLTFPARKDVGSHEITSVEKRLNSFPHYNSDCQVCVNEEKMKNLVKVESQTEKRAAGATAQAEVKGKIVDFVWWMKKQVINQPQSGLTADILRFLLTLAQTFWTTLNPLRKS